MSKVLILTETIGGNGHYRAADAVLKGLQHVEPRLPVDITCGLPHFSRQLEGFVRRVYLNTLQFAPGLWGAAYSKEEEFSDTFRSSLGKVLAHKLEEYFDQVRPQVVVCTHAFCLGAAGVVKERGRIPFRLGTAITDFDVNGFWVHPSVDFYLVAHESVADKLQSRHGIPGERIYRTGIPIDPAFSRTPSPKREVRVEMAMDPDPFTVLLMGGGVGLGPLEHAIKQFDREMPEAQLVVITGKNKSLLERLRSRFDGKPNIRLLGYVDRMADWMSASDLIVSKPGGLTSSEALATGLPLLICRPIPGQEERNSRFLTEQRVALRQDQPRSIPRHIHPLMQDPGRWEEMSRRAKGLGKPRSSLDAAQVILQYLS
ncbi:MGDG synthase family glycosyltransferase [Paludifilum halophilum]|uniref:Galactosyldiacylglycerol synthase n=1 Tax=Paludifilum halophilum TaxID=1642702 RepID=A0A235B607_9BACL|nr:glycosyltransferase [Paludifilum halophilum]OYD07734.1 hypothetical protein CHM34_09685 [Paludifilum halophilum]